MQNQSGIVLDRKILSGLAMYEPFSFKAVVDVVQAMSVEGGVGKVRVSAGGWQTNENLIQLKLLHVVDVVDVVQSNEGAWSNSRILLAVVVSLTTITFRRPGIPT
jgi:hypothetical protein